MKKIVLITCALAFAHVAGAQAVRLKAQSKYRYQTGGYVIQDTSFLHYSFGRSHHDPNAGQHFTPWAADAVTTLLYDPGTSQFHNQNLVTQEFSGWQTLHSYSSDWMGGSWDTTFRYTYSYDADLIDTFYFDVKNSGTWARAQRTTFTYGTDGPLTRLQSAWSTQQNDYVDTTRYTTAYSAGKPIQQLKEVFVGGTWQPHSRETNTYTGNNLTAIVYENYIGGWQNSKKSEFMYNSQTNDLIQKDYYSWDSGAWKPTSKLVLAIDSNHDCFLEWYFVHDGTQWLDFYRKDHEYYAPGFLSVSTYSSFNTTTFQYEPQVNDPKDFYYYEEINPASVSNTLAQSNVLRVYPNPASRIINISLPEAQSDPFSITIFDATGRSVRHWNEAPTKVYQKQVNVEALLSGNYFLRINNRPQQTVQFTIVK